MGFGRCKNICDDGSIPVYPIYGKDGYVKTGRYACMNCMVAFEPIYINCPCCSRKLRFKPYRKSKEQRKLRDSKRY